MIETETLTNKDWILFIIVVAFVTFLAIAIFLILTGPDGSYPPRMYPMLPLELQ